MQGKKILIYLFFFILFTLVSNAQVQMIELQKTSEKINEIRTENLKSVTPTEQVFYEQTKLIYNTPFCGNTGNPETSVICEFEFEIYIDDDYLVNSTNTIIYYKNSRDRIVDINPNISLQFGKLENISEVIEEVICTEIELSAKDKETTKLNVTEICEKKNKTVVRERKVFGKSKLTRGANYIRGISTNKPSDVFVDWNFLIKNISFESAKINFDTTKTDAGKGWATWDTLDNSTSCIQFLLNNTWNYNITNATITIDLNETTLDYNKIDSNGYGIRPYKGGCNNISNPLYFALADGERAKYFYHDPVGLNTVINIQYNETINSGEQFFVSLLSSINNTRSVYDNPNITFFVYDDFNSLENDTTQKWVCYNCSTSSVSNGILTFTGLADSINRPSLITRNKVFPEVHPVEISSEIKIQGANDYLIVGAYSLNTRLSGGAPKACLGAIYLGYSATNRMYSNVSMTNYWGLGEYTTSSSPSNSEYKNWTAYLIPNNSYVLRNGTNLTSNSINLTPTQGMPINNILNESSKYFFFQGREIGGETANIKFIVAKTQRDTIKILSYEINPSFDIKIIDKTSGIFNNTIFNRTSNNIQLNTTRGANGSFTSIITNWTAYSSDKGDTINVTISGEINPNTSLKVAYRGYTQTNISNLAFWAGFDDANGTTFSTWTPYYASPVVTGSGTRHNVSSNSAMCNDNLCFSQWGSSSALNYVLTNGRLNASNFTMAVWVYIDWVDDNNPVYYAVGGDTNNEYFLLRYGSSNKIIFNYNGTQYMGNGSYITSKLQFLAVTVEQINATNATIKIYQNQTLVYGITTGIENRIIARVHLAANANGNDRYVAYHDNFLYFNKPLTQAEITQLYNEYNTTKWTSFTDYCDLEKNISGCLFNKTSNFTQIRFIFETNQTNKTPTLETIYYKLLNLSSLASSTPCISSYSGGLLTFSGDCTFTKKIYVIGNLIVGNFSTTKSILFHNSDSSGVRFKILKNSRFKLADNEQIRAVPSDEAEFGGTLNVIGNADYDCMTTVCAIDAYCCGNTNGYWDSVCLGYASGEGTCNE